MNIYAKVSEHNLIKPLYEGIDTDQISLHVNNSDRTISANLSDSVVEGINEINKNQKSIEDRITSLDNQLNEIPPSLDYIRTELPKLSDDVQSKLPSNGWVANTEQGWTKTFDSGYESKLTPRLIELPNDDGSSISYLSPDNIRFGKSGEGFKDVVYSADGILQYVSDPANDYYAESTLTFPDKSGTLALTSDIDDAQVQLEASINELTNDLDTFSNSFNTISNQLIDNSNKFESLISYRDQGVYIPLDVTSAEYQERLGKYLAPDGQLGTGNSYAYTERFNVTPGDVIYLTSYLPDNLSSPNNYTSRNSMRFGCGYDINGNVSRALGFNESNGLTEYTIPEGCYQIAVTYTRAHFTNGYKPVFASNIGILKPVLNNDSNSNDANIAISNVLGGDSLSASSKVLNESSKLQLENNTVVTNKILTFSGTLTTSFGDNSLLRLGHGKSDYGSSYIEVRSNDLLIYNMPTSEPIQVAHGLRISDYINIQIINKPKTTTINISTSTGEFSTSKNWSGRNGEIFAEVENLEINNPCIRWFSSDYQQPIWIIGDSYISTKDPSRWTYYLYNNFDNFMLLGHSGMGSPRGIVEFKQALQHGTPKYAIWCMGMNNEDSSNAINGDYLSATNEFISMCKARGIAPIICTIPSTPIVYNEEKNNWIRNWAQGIGNRIIDLATSVCDGKHYPDLVGSVISNASAESTKTNKTGYIWYDAMIYSDGVHPATSGAKAIYSKFISDFPEIIK